MAIRRLTRKSTTRSLRIPKSHQVGNNKQTRRLAYGKLGRRFRTTTTTTTGTTTSVTTFTTTTTSTQTTTTLLTTTSTSTTTSTTTTLVPTTTSTSTSTTLTTTSTTSTTTTVALTTTSTTTTLVVTTSTTSTTTTLAPTTTSTTTTLVPTTTSTTTTLVPTTTSTTTTVAPTTTSSTTTTVAPTTTSTTTTVAPTTTSTTTVAGTTTTTTTGLFETEFSEYGSGSPAGDWTERWNTGSQSNLVEACDCAAGMHLPDQTQHLALTSTGAYDGILSWDDVDGQKNVDVLMMIGNINDNDEAIRLHVRASGTEGHEYSYFIHITTVMYLGKLIDGSKTNLSSVLYGKIFADQAYWWRFRVQGNSLKFKHWNVWTVEPNDWLLEATDSDISSGGWIGFGAESDLVLDVNYFGVATGGRAISVDDASVLFRKRRARYFGTLYIEALNDEAINWVDAMGGHIVSGSGRYLVGIRFRTAATTDDSAYVRLAAYSGGDLATGPDGATLLADSGQVLADVVDGWNYYYLPSPVAVPDNTPLWVAIKANDATVDLVYRGESGISGDYQLARGRFRSDTIDTDESVAWPATWPADGGGFSGRWRAVEAIFDSQTTSTTTTE